MATTEQPPVPKPAASGSAAMAIVALRGASQARVRHVELVPARAGAQVEWPSWADPVVVQALRTKGVVAPWRHQAQAADLAHEGRHVVLATGTASGKSLAYLLPLLTAIRRDVGPGLEARRRTALYLAPTKALAADQLAMVDSLHLPGLRAAAYDGDTATEERRWIRHHAGYVLSNPDLVHHSLLPGHERWGRFLRGLDYVVVDECHHYRGVFGSHVAAVVRRLRRVAEHYGASPTFILASATVADPAAHARCLTGLPVTAVTDDASPRGRTHVVLWEPPLTGGGGPDGATTRRSAAAETSDLLADLVSGGVATLAFVRSRRGAEQVASATHRLLADVDPALPQRVAAYRGGYLPEERRALEGALRDGRLLALAATNALELGIDVAGLDAVLIAGWPGRRASLWQQVGRAGRQGQDAAAVLIAADDPLDTYLMHHPEAVFGAPVEASVLDPDNPHVLSPQLTAAAAELPITTDDLPLFGASARPVLDALVARGVLRHRRSGWFVTRTDRAAASQVDLRGSGTVVRLVEASTGRVLGTVDSAAADHSVHAGAVYVHQGDTYLVEELDLEQGLALLEPANPGWTTHARTVSDVRLLQTLRRGSWGRVDLRFGVARISTQVVSFVRRRAVTGEVLGEELLDLPPRHLATKAAWWTAPDDLLLSGAVTATRLPGSLHAAEHAMIALLPLFASCDRWDVGGLSTARHPDTGRATVVVHDGQPGGAGFAERGFSQYATWLRATRAAVAGCGCSSGCPSCVQSPKCGNGNEPLDKAGALLVLDAVLTAGAEAGFQQDEPDPAQ